MKATPSCSSALSPVTVHSLVEGELVHVFHRYCQDPNGYFMADSAHCGIMHPSVGLTDGWTTAVVSEEWDISSYQASDFNTWPKIEWSHPTWYNRRGIKLNVAQKSMVTQRVRADQIRQVGESCEADAQPKLTLVHLRWGGATPVNAVTEGAGGWGQIGSTPSDNYINGWENTVYQAMGPTYEVISVFFQSSQELLRICPALLKKMARGKHIGAFYFMWPINYSDGHNFPAYVDKERELRLMVEMEGCAIPTRFPHHSNLYKTFASKEWPAQMCLHPLLKVPLTTQVSKYAIACDPAKAAHNANLALQSLAQARSQWTQECGMPSPPTQVNRGVAKLGWSWEAMDVRAWTNMWELEHALVPLAQQPDSNVDMVFVQEWVDFDVEIRHFIVEPDLDDPESLKPKKRIYTVFKSKDAGCFREFDRYDRNNCVRETFQNDDAALADAERQADELISRWVQWLQGISHELPTVVRFDILAKRTGPGKASIATGELTELGGCFLGWEQGPETVFGAMLRSCFKDVA